MASSVRTFDQSPALTRPRSMTMSISSARSRTASCASCAFAPECTAPEGNPHTVATFTPFGTLARATAAIDGETQTA